MKPAVTIYIDESFSEWMGLKTAQANFVYGSVIVPRANSKSLAEGWLGIEKKIAGFYLKRKRTLPKEIKYKTISGLWSDDREVLVQHIKELFNKTEVYFMVFFSTVEGLLNNQLRDDHFDQVAKFSSLSASERLEKVETIKQDMINEWKATKLAAIKTGDFVLTQHMFKYLSGCIAQFRSSNYGKYKIIVDSRGVDDLAIKACFEAQLEILEQIFPDAKSSFQGMNFNDSKITPNLRAADFVAGMVREFFVENPDILNDGSILKILSACYNEEMTIVRGTGPFYQHALSSQNIASLTAPSPSTLLPYFLPYFAEGKISAFAKYGEARVIDLHDRNVWDMAD